MKNLFAKSALSFLFLFANCFYTAAQSDCRFSEIAAPLLLNLQIGMSSEQVRAHFGTDLKVKIKKKGERVFFQNFIKNPAPNSLKGVRALYLRFFDGKLYQAEIFYEPRPDLKTLEEITAALSAQANFPVSAWQIKNRRAEAVCDDLSLAADNVLNPRVEFTDEKKRRLIKENRTKDGAKK